MLRFKVNHVKPHRPKEDETRLFARGVRALNTGYDYCLIGLNAALRKNRFEVGLRAQWRPPCRMVMNLKVRKMKIDFKCERIYHVTWVRSGCWWTCPTTCRALHTRTSLKRKNKLNVDYAPRMACENCGLSRSKSTL